MQQLSLQVRLSMLGAPALQRALEADPPRRREILVDEGASPALVSEFDGLELNEHEAIFLQAVRIAGDRNHSSVADESLKAAQFRRQWSVVTGTEDLGIGHRGDLRQWPGTGAIDYSRLRSGSSDK